MKVRLEAYFYIRVVSKMCFVSVNFLLIAMIYRLEVCFLKSGRHIY